MDVLFTPTKYYRTDLTCGGKFLFFSLALANAYTEAGVSYELHIYPDGPHGVSLANKITMTDCKGWIDESIAKWVENAVYWANKL